MSLQTSSAPVRTVSLPRNLPIILLLFVGSGCAALIYEIVWLQLLSLIIGATAISLGVLLGTFMGGMCLGSLVLPRLIPTSRHPLRVYAALELMIGACGLLILWFMPAVANFYTQFGGEGWSGIIFRGIVSGICLLPPTILMGATLPAISRWVRATPEGVSWMGFFYGGNTAGAVVGCLLAGFWLLPKYNMDYATKVAFVINLSVTLLALALSAFESYQPPAAESSRKREAADDGDVWAPWAWCVYITIGLSGLTGLGAEVVWTRLLSLMLGATVYTFSIILAVFLLGLGIGSSVGSMWARATRQPRQALGLCQLLLAGAIGWTTYAICDMLPYWPSSPWLTTLTPNGPWFGFQFDMARCMWAVLPPALMWGASFPLALAGVAKRRQDPGRLVGGVYAANTIGAIIGALAFSMWVIPTFGTLGANQILIVIAAVSSLFAFVPLFIPQPIEELPDGEFPPLWRPIVGACAIIVAMFLVASMVLELPAIPDVVVAWGRYSADPSITNMALPDEPPDQYTVPSREKVYVGEGMNVSVEVTKMGGNLYFHGAGKVQASTDPQDMRLQRTLGHLSALIAAKNEDVLVVACGAGVTAGSFVPYPTVKHITICDIEPMVPKFVAPQFHDVNYSVVTDKRTTVVIDDGRHFVRTSKQKFDIITSDPIDPWVKGCAALNTVEYYQMCRDHLNPGGVMSLWIPLYENKLESVKSIISTFFQVFPNGIIFSNEIREGGGSYTGYDAVLLGQTPTDKPIQIDLDRLQQMIDTEPYRPVKASLMDVGFGVQNGEVIMDLMSTYASQGGDMGPWIQDAKDNDWINTDANLRLQFLAGLYLDSHDETKIFEDILRYYRFPEKTFIGSPQTVEAMKQLLIQDGRARFTSSAAPVVAPQTLAENARR